MRFQSLKRTLVAASIFIIASVAGSSAVTANGVLSVQMAISVPGTGGMQGITISPDNSEVYVGRGSQIHVIDTASNTVVRSMVLALPANHVLVDLASHPELPNLYALSFHQSGRPSRLTIVDPATLSQVEALDSGPSRRFDRVRIPQDDSSHYFLIGDGFDRVRSSDNLTFQSFDLPDQATRGDISHDGTKVYGQHTGSSSSDGVVAYDSISGTGLGSFGTGDAGQGVHYTKTASGAERVLVFAGQGSLFQRIFVLDGATLGHFQTIDGYDAGWATDATDGESVLVTNVKSVVGGNELSLIRLSKGEGSDWAVTEELTLAVSGTALGADRLVAAPLLGKYYVISPNTGQVFVVAGDPVFVVDSDGDGVPDAEDDCPSEDSTGFDVDNDGCVDTPQGLIQIIATLPSETLSDELQNSLVSKVANAQKSSDKANICAGVSQLRALINQVDAQRGKKVSDVVADDLIAYAESVIAALISQLPAGETCK